MGDPLLESDDVNDQASRMSSMDLYEDLLIRENGGGDRILTMQEVVLEKQSLADQNRQLLEKLAEKTIQAEKLLDEKLTLQKNFDVLLATAKIEIMRKNRLLNHYVGGSQNAVSQASSSGATFTTRPPDKQKKLQTVSLKGRRIQDEELLGRRIQPLVTDDGNRSGVKCALLHHNTQKMVGVATRVVGSNFETSMRYREKENRQIRESIEQIVLPAINRYGSTSENVSNQRAAPQSSEKDSEYEATSVSTEDTSRNNNECFGQKISMKSFPVKNSSKSAQNVKLCIGDEAIKSDINSKNRNLSKGVKERLVRSEDTDSNTFERKASKSAKSVQSKDQLNIKQQDAPVGKADLMQTFVKINERRSVADKASTDKRTGKEQHTPSHAVIVNAKKPSDLRKKKTIASTQSSATKEHGRSPIAEKISTDTRSGHAQHAPSRDVTEKNPSDLRKKLTSRRLRSGSQTSIVESEKKSSRKREAEPAMPERHQIRESTKTEGSEQDHFVVLDSTDCTDLEEGEIRVERLSKKRSPQVSAEETSLRKSLRRTPRKRGNNNKVSNRSKNTRQEILTMSPRGHTSSVEEGEIVTDLEEQEMCQKEELSVDSGAPMLGSKHTTDCNDMKVTTTEVLDRPTLHSDSGIGSLRLSESAKDHRQVLEEDLLELETLELDYDENSLMNYEVMNHDDVIKKGSVMKPIVTNENSAVVSDIVIKSHDVIVSNNDTVSENDGVKIQKSDKSGKQSSKKTMTTSEKRKASPKNVAKGPFSSSKRSLQKSASNSNLREEMPSPLTASTQLIDKSSEITPQIPDVLVKSSAEVAGLHFPTTRTPSQNDVPDMVTGMHDTQDLSGKDPLANTKQKLDTELCDATDKVEHDRQNAVPDVAVKTSETKNSGTKNPLGVTRQELHTEWRDVSNKTGHYLQNSVREVAVELRGAQDLSAENPLAGTRRKLDRELCDVTNKLERDIQQGILNVMMSPVKSCLSPEQMKHICSPSVKLRRLEMPPVENVATDGTQPATVLVDVLCDEFTSESERNCDSVDDTSETDCLMIDERDSSCYAASSSQEGTPAGSGVSESTAGDRCEERNVTGKLVRNLSVEFAGSMNECESAEKTSFARFDVEVDISVNCSNISEEVDEVSTSPNGENKAQDEECCNDHRQWCPEKAIGVTPSPAVPRSLPELRGMALRPLNKAQILGSVAETEESRIHFATENSVCVDRDAVKSSLHGSTAASRCSRDTQVGSGQIVKSLENGQDARTGVPPSGVLSDSTSTIVAAETLIALGMQATPCVIQNKVAETDAGTLQDDTVKSVVTVTSVAQGAQDGSVSIVSIVSTSTKGAGQNAMSKMGLAVTPVAWRAHDVSVTAVTTATQGVDRSMVIPLTKPSRAIKPGSGEFFPGEATVTHGNVAEMALGASGSSLTVAGSGAEALAAAGTLLAVGSFLTNTTAAMKSQRSGPMPAQIEHRAKASTLPLTLPVSGTPKVCDNLSFPETSLTTGMMGVGSEVIVDNNMSANHSSSEEIAFEKNTTDQINREEICTKEVRGKALETSILSGMDTDKSEKCDEKIEFGAKMKSKKAAKRKRRSSKKAVSAEPSIKNSIKRSKISKDAADHATKKVTADFELSQPTATKERNSNKKRKKKKSRAFTVSSSPEHDVVEVSPVLKRWLKSTDDGKHSLNITAVEQSPVVSCPKPTEHKTAEKRKHKYPRDTDSPANRPITNQELVEKKFRRETSPKSVVVEKASKESLHAGATAHKCTKDTGSPTNRFIADQKFVGGKKHCETSPKTGVTEKASKESLHAGATVLRHTDGTPHQGTDKNLHHGDANGYSTQDAPAKLPIAPSKTGNVDKALTDTSTPTTYAGLEMHRENVQFQQVNTRHVDTQSRKGSVRKRTLHKSMKVKDKRSLDKHPITSAKCSKLSLSVKANQSSSNVDNRASVANAVPVEKDCDDQKNRKRADAKKLEEQRKNVIAADATGPNPVKYVGTPQLDQSPPDVDPKLPNCSSQLPPGVCNDQDAVGKSPHNTRHRSVSDTITVDSSRDTESTALACSERARPLTLFNQDKRRRDHDSHTVPSDEANAEDFCRPLKQVAVGYHVNETIDAEAVSTTEDASDDFTPTVFPATRNLHCVSDAMRSYKNAALQLLIHMARQKQSNLRGFKIKVPMGQHSSKNISITQSQPETLPNNVAKERNVAETHSSSTAPSSTTNETLLTAKQNRGINIKNCSVPCLSHSIPKRCLVPNRSFAEHDQNQKYARTEEGAENVSKTKYSAKIESEELPTAAPPNFRPTKTTPEKSQTVNEKWDKIAVTSSTREACASSVTNNSLKMPAKNHTAGKNSLHQSCKFNINTTEACSATDAHAQAGVHGKDAERMSGVHNGVESSQSRRTPHGSRDRDGTGFERPQKPSHLQSFTVPQKSARSSTNNRQPEKNRAQVVSTKPSKARTDAVGGKKCSRNCVEDVEEEMEFFQDEFAGRLKSHGRKKENRSNAELNKKFKQKMTKDRNRQSREKDAKNCITSNEVSRRVSEPGVPVTTSANKLHLGSVEKHGKKHVADSFRRRIEAIAYSSGQLPFRKKPKQHFSEGRVKDKARFNEMRHAPVVRNKPSRNKEKHKLRLEYRSLARRSTDSEIANQRCHQRTRSHEGQIGDYVDGREGRTRSFEQHSEQRYETNKKQSLRADTFRSEYPGTSRGRNPGGSSGHNERRSSSREEEWCSGRVSSEGRSRSNWVSYGQHNKFTKREKKKNKNGSGTSAERSTSRGRSDPTAKNKIEPHPVSRHGSAPTSMSAGHTSRIRYEFHPDDPVLGHTPTKTPSLHGNEPSDTSFNKQLKKRRHIMRWEDGESSDENWDKLLKKHVRKRSTSKEEIDTSLETTDVSRVMHSGVTERQHSTQPVFRSPEQCKNGSRQMTANKTPPVLARNMWMSSLRDCQERRKKRARWSSEVGEELVTTPEAEPQDVCFFHMNGSAPNDVSHKSLDDHTHSQYGYSPPGGAVDKQHRKSSKTEVSVTCNKFHGSPEPREMSESFDHVVRSPHARRNAPHVGASEPPVPSEAGSSSSSSSDASWEDGSCSEGDDVAQNEPHGGIPEHDTGVTVDSDFFNQFSTSSWQLSEESRSRFHSFAKVVKALSPLKPSPMKLHLPPQHAARPPKKNVRRKVLQSPWKS